MECNAPRPLEKSRLKMAGRSVSGFNKETRYLVAGRTPSSSCAGFFLFSDDVMIKIDLANPNRSYTTHQSYLSYE